MGSLAKEASCAVAPKYGQLDTVQKRKALEPHIYQVHLQNTLGQDFNSHLWPFSKFGKRPRLLISSCDPVDVENLHQLNHYNPRSCTDISSNISSTDSDGNDYSTNYSQSTCSSTSRSSSRTPDPESNLSRRISDAPVPVKTLALVDNEQKVSLCDHIGLGKWIVEIFSVDQSSSPQEGIVFEGPIGTDLDIIQPYYGNTEHLILDEDSEHSSVTTVDGPPSSQTSQLGSSVVETDEASSSSDSSSQSHESLNRGDEDEDNCANSETLEHLIKNDVLKTNPDLADIVFRELDGLLEYIPSSQIKFIKDSSHLSLLQYFMLQRPINSPFTTYAPSTTSSETFSSGSSSNETGQSSSSSSNQAGRGQQRDSAGARDGASQQGSGQSINVQKKPSRSNLAKSNNLLLLRCIYNALMPEIFCVNNETREKYRPCAGPGYGSIQHLKEHLQTHHTIKANPFQCNQCQQDFGSQSSLQSHGYEVDCPIRCPDCDDTFQKKSLRQAHQEKYHPRTGNSQCLDIDIALDKQIKEKLKAYTDSLKKGKNPSDPILQQWVDRNMARFMNGRSVSESKARLELGQWYTIHRVVAPNKKVLDHPFYDYSAPDPDVSTETILLVNQKMVQSKMQSNGPPPLDFVAQCNWYQEALRDALSIAARTRIISRDAGVTPLSVTTTAPISDLLASNTPDFGTINGVDCSMASQQQALITGGQHSQLSLQAQQFFPSQLESISEVANNVSGLANFPGWPDYPQDGSYSMPYEPSFYELGDTNDLLEDPQYRQQNWEGR